MNYYMFTFKEGERIPTYERTMGTVEDAIEWVQKNKNVNGFFTFNCLPRKYFS